MSKIPTSTPPPVLPTVPAKRFNIMTRVGKARYVVNHHDGIKVHNDGSPFFDIAIFTNRREMEKFISGLRRSGYVEE